MNYAFLDSPVGPLLIAGDAHALHHIWFAKGGQPAKPRHGWKESEEGVVGQAMQQLRQYFAGNRVRFDLPLSPAGTAFQKSVWLQLREIPYGRTISYGELAKRIGNAKASRAVGSANGKNPLPIVVPCHRVIQGTGKIGGFSGGLDIKEKLLKMEARNAEKIARDSYSVQLTGV
jgi:methylated-DNA-[protein]-cysteine S-methyltransferase